MMNAKIHRAVVTQADLNYIGSITIDEDLLDAVGMLQNEKVHVVDNNNGARFETYIIAGERGSGVICVNGAAARLVQKVMSSLLCLMPMLMTKKRKIINQL